MSVLHYTSPSSKCDFVCEIEFFPEKGELQFDLSNKTKFSSVCSNLSIEDAKKLTLLLASKIALRHPEFAEEISDIIEI